MKSAISHVILVSSEAVFCGRTEIPRPTDSIEYVGASIEMAVAIAEVEPACHHVQGVPGHNEDPRGLLCVDPLNGQRGMDRLDDEAFALARTGWRSGQRHRCFQREIWANSPDLGSC
jgi:hypothetical protein